MRVVLTVGFVASLPLPALADCKADLGAVFAAHRDAGPYHIEMTMTSNGSSQKMKGKVILPDRMQMTTPEGEMIIVKKDAWMKIGGSWTKLPGAAGAMVQGAIKQGIANGMKGTSNVQCLGTVEYNDGSYDGYEFDSNGNFGGVKSKSHVILYVDAKGLPAWSVIKGKAMGVDSTIVQRITFDPDIKIKAPK